MKSLGIVLFFVLGSVLGWMVAALFTPAESPGERGTGGSANSSGGGSIGGPLVSLTKAEDSRAALEETLAMRIPSRERIDRYTRIMMEWIQSDPESAASWFFTLMFHKSC